MILIDLNQVLLSGLMAQISSQKGTKLDEDLVRHLILNIIRMHVKNFRREYGEVVLACDNRKYWRKEYFPFYKAGRKKSREKSDLDWHMIFNMLAKFKEELKENFPYKIIDVEGAEADDVIGTLVPRHAPHEKVLILSSDGDFLQLQRYGANVKQYNPAQKKYIKEDNPIEYLKLHIIEGDKGDGIPNVLSPGDVFVREARQKPLTKGIKQKLVTESVDTWNVTEQEYWSRNQTLIDLTFIPKEIQEKIINTYEEAKPAPRNKLLNYFIKNKLKNLMDVIEDF
jgi:5'-3' exonuclease